MTISKPILVWSIPRSTSTALERAFIQRPDCVCLHEPFGEPYYYGPQRLSQRYSENSISESDAKDVKYDDIVGLITDTSLQNPTKTVVVKDMASYIVKPELIDSASEQNPTILSDDTLKGFRHAFLIRSPRKSITSYYRAILDNDCGDFGDFDPNEAGFKELNALFVYIRKLLPNHPTVLIDSDNLVNDPSKTLQLLCDRIGLEFSDLMLNWESKRIQDFDKWKGFHEDAQNSTGFKPVEREQLDLPQHVEDAIKENEETYKELLKFALR